MLLRQAFAFDTDTFFFNFHRPNSRPVWLALLGRLGDGTAVDASSHLERVQVIDRTLILMDLTGDDWRMLTNFVGAGPVRMLFGRVGEGMLRLRRPRTELQSVELFSCWDDAPPLAPRRLDPMLPGKKLF